MANCSCCGSEIPDNQRVCSMCYGDIDYGNDGYYRERANKQEELLSPTIPQNETKEI